jgi:hypothetical protein
VVTRERPRGVVVLARLSRRLADALAEHKRDLAGQHRAVGDIQRIESVAAELHRGIALAVAGLSPEARAKIWPHGSRHPDLLAAMQ